MWDRDGEQVWLGDWLIVAFAVGCTFVIDALIILGLIILVNVLF